MKKKRLQKKNEVGKKTKGGDAHKSCKKKVVENKKTRTSISNFLLLLKL
jgi:hypothetical protein